LLQVFKTLLAGVLVAATRQKSGFRPVLLCAKMNVIVVSGSNTAVKDYI
jgi:hypothetical protein